MVNVIVYLNSQHDPAALFEELFQKELVATVSVDIDNAFYQRSAKGMERVVHTVITMQTRALLFNEICEVIQSRYGTDVCIHSTPIVAANSTFEHLIKSSTKEPDKRIITVHAQQKKTA